MTDLFQPPDNVSNALANKLAEQHARAAIKQHDAAVVDLTAMRDQYHTLISRGAHRPDSQLQLFRRRAEALEYAITQLTEEPTTRPPATTVPASRRGNPSEPVKW